MTTPSPGTAIDLPGAANVRDLGGWPVSGGGVVRHGQVYRSTELNGLTGEGVARLASLGVRTVCDLRTAAERDAQPDRLPDGARETHLDVLADEPANVTAGVADLPKLLADPKTVEEFLAGTSAEAMVADVYRAIVTLPSAKSSYHAMFSKIAEVQQRPLLFHCTTGKDRTGWGSAALLSFLGVSHDDVVAEYLLTNTEILPLTQPMYDGFAAAGGDPALLRPVLGVEESYLNTAFEEMESRFGSVTGYLSEGLGLPDDTLDALHVALVDR